MRSKLLSTSFLFSLIINHGYSQVFSNKELGQQNQDIIDSLRSADYPYLFPIWSKKATAEGFNPLYSARLGINYVCQESNIVIDNLQAGFNDGPRNNMDKKCGLAIPPSRVIL